MIIFSHCGIIFKYCLWLSWRNGIRSWWLYACWWYCCKLCFTKIYQVVMHTNNYTASQMREIFYNVGTGQVHFAGYI